MSDRPVHTVHLVAKTHLDLGFTGLAREVVEQYLFDFFPRAIDIAAELDRTGGPSLTWTTGSWILREALDRHPDRHLARRVDDAVRRGVLAWHGLALTTHTELLDAAVFRHGLGISAELDRRFGRHTTAAKMTDVPGHTRAMVPLLADAGIRFLHIGVNPAWPVPEVPPVFRWRSPEGAEIVVAYSAGGYGHDTQVPGTGLQLSFLHSGDNLGPPSADEVRAAHERLAARHPGAQILGSTLDRYRADLAATGITSDLPVVESEIGDPWIFGVASDPQKTSRHRRLLSRTAARRDTLGPEATAPVDELLLLTAEHTWGLDQKITYPTEPEWDDTTLRRLRTEEHTRRFEASWTEQRRYVEGAEELLDALTADGPDGSEGSDDRGGPEGPGHPDRSDGSVDPIDRGEPEIDHSAAPRRDGPGTLEGDGTVAVGGRWRLRLDPDTGAVVSLVDREDGHRLADPDHRLGTLTHQRFSATDYDRFLATLTPTDEDRWWAIRDNTKPGVDAAGAVSDHRAVRLLDAAIVDSHDSTTPGSDDAPHARSEHGRRAAIQLRLGFDEDRPGAPVDITAVWSWTVDAADPELRLELAWTDKPATRLPEALWLGWNPLVTDPDRWELEKLGSWISPLDVVRHGGRALHAVGAGGVRHIDPRATTVLRSRDAPLIAPGAPNLLDADPPVPDLAVGWHVLLYDNCWGTNFPMWNEGPARFEFELGRSPSTRGGG